LITGDQFLRHNKLVALQAIQAQQQPPAQLLIERMVAITNRRLRHLRDQRLGVAQQQMQHGARAAELILNGWR
jgi:hypothetical protein